MIKSRDLTKQNYVGVKCLVTVEELSCLPLRKNRNSQSAVNNQHAILSLSEPYRSSCTTVLFVLMKSQLLTSEFLVYVYCAIQGVLAFRCDIQMKATE